MKPMNLSNVSINTQSSIRIEGNKIIYFDPWKITEARNDADVIFVTHEHHDHYDPESIANISKNTTIVVAPTSMEEIILKDLKMESCFLNPNEAKQIAGLDVKAIPAYNNLKPFHTKSKNWLGYVVDLDGTKYYVAGDTDDNADIRKVDCDVALVPIGGKFTMDYKEAAKYILCLKPKAAVPTHFGDIIGSPTDGREFKKIVEAGDKDIQVELIL